MLEVLRNLRAHPMFRAAMIVPTSIMLIFSVFNLTAPPDPARQAASFQLGIVNQDKGSIFPPIKVSEKVLEGLLGNLPFTVTHIVTTNAARDALEQGDVAAVLIFPETFTKTAMSSEQVEFEIWNSQHLTIAETALGAQLPTMLQLGMSAAVASMREALAAGRLPTAEMPVTAKIETFNKAQSGASLVAPFVMTSATWLAAMVGAIMLFLATKGVPYGASKALVRTIVPVISLGLASLALAGVVSLTIGDGSLFLPVWMTVWGAAVCIGWLINGLFAIFGMWSLIAVLPAAFYQPAIGGVQAPITAAPEWLSSIAEVLPFDQLGATYRSIILGGGSGIPVTQFVWVGLNGLVLIWLGSIFIDNMRAK
ncbi:MAG: hypothetical protein KAS85_01270 [Rhodobacteraceae bacterium]|nr:hypothetical protein [Paracoccaceae bacterium]